MSSRDDRIWTLGVLVVLALAAVIARPRPVVEEALSEKSHATFSCSDPLGHARQEEHANGRYVLRTRRASSGPATFELILDGQIVARKRPEDRAMCYGIAPGSTFGQEAGVGVPVLCVQGYCGGTYPHGSTYVFGLGEPLRLIAYCPDSPGDAHFDDLEGNGGLQLLCTDPNCLRAFKNYPRIIFRLTPGGFKIAPDLMSRLPIPSADDLHREASALRHLKVENADPAYLWDLRATSTMDPLIHSGRADLAWAFFDEAWPRGAPGKAAMRNAYRARLRASPWFADLQKMEAMPHIPALQMESWTPLYFRM